ncbi:MAG: hypothetical protein ACMG57_04485 [Candidatus Dojkabacteria bacterium]
MSQPDTVSHDLSKYQSDYPKIIAKLVTLGVPITIIATIIFLLLGSGNQENPTLRINIPRMLGDSTSVLMDTSRNIGAVENAGWLSSNSAFFSDGSILNTNGYDLGDGFEELKGLPKFYSTEQIDDKKALIWSFSQSDNRFNLWLFTRGDKFPEHTIVALMPLKDIIMNGRMDYLEQDGARNLLFEGSVNQQSGVFMFNVDTGSYTLLETDKPVITYAVNSKGDMYYFTKPNDGNVTTLVYGTIEGGKFIKRKGKAAKTENYANNILSDGLEVDDNGTFTYLYNNAGIARNPTLGDIQIIKVRRDLTETDGATLDKFDFSDSVIGDSTPFITSTS